MIARIVGCAWAVVLVAGAAQAQATRPNRPIAEGLPPAGLLAGPEVREADGADAPFGGSGRPGTVSTRKWFDVLGRLDLDSDQRRAAGGIRRELQAAWTVYREECGQRLDVLAAEAREAREAGTRLPFDQRRELDRLKALRPDVTAYQMRIWSLLDESRRNRMRAELDAIRRREALDRAERDAVMGESGLPGDDDAAATLDEAGRRRLSFLIRHRAQRPEQQQ